MASNKSPSSDNEPQVVSFRRRGTGARTPAAPPPPVNDLSKYQQGTGTDDYRHRMIVNAVALVFVIALIGAGLWLADAMERMRNVQDCVLSGRSNCAPVGYNNNR
jgi:hypothetical protein